MSGTNTTVITISRQMASGGAYIGYLLAKKLGYKYVEREVLILAAKELGVELVDLAHRDECCDSFVEKMMKSFMFGTPEAVYVPPARRPVYDQELYDVECRIIKDVVERYNAVIVGRGGYSILSGRPGVVNVLIHAPLDFRIERLRKFNSLTEDQARQEIQESDRKREKFLKTMTSTDRYDARNYHLCIDAAAAGFETAQRMIVELVEKNKRDRE